MKLADKINIIFNKLIASRHSLSIEEIGRRRLLAAFLLMNIPADIVFGIYYIVNGSYILAILDIILALIMTLLIIFLRHFKNVKPLYRIITLLFSLTFLYWIKTGTAQGYSIIWAMILPLFSFSLLGKKEGFMWSALFTVTMLYIIINPYSYLSFFPYSSQYISRFLYTYFVIVLFAYSYESIREKYKSVVEAEQSKLLLEKEKLAEAKDETDRANSRLKFEIKVREQAEIELRRHRDNLEDIVTERTLEIKQNSNKLEESEKRYRLMADNVDDLIWTTDLNRNFTFISPSVYKSFGYTVDEAMKLTPDKWLTPESYIRTINHYIAEMELEKAGNSDPDRSVVLEVERVKKDGTVYPSELKVSFIREKNGEPIGIVGISRDITERKRAEKEHEKLQVQLIQAQKMDAVGRLAGGVAHDFNNMLGVILGRVDIAMMKTDPAQLPYKDLLEIRKAAERSADLTRQLLAFARKQTVELKVLDLNETVESMLKMLRRLIGEDIDLVWLPDKGLWPVKMDPSQIDQILANLCVNARDAIAGVGKVTIETGSASFDKAYCADHAGFAPGEYVLLAVSDDGCGMDKETLGKLFEPFFTTKGVGKGTGLGLSTVYGIVKQNNGLLNVYSEPGQGTTFMIYIPRNMGEAEQVSKDDPVSIDTTGSETILIAEDEPAILEMTTTMLQNLGYTVLKADTPRGAIRIAEEHVGPIHLLMTDVVMPEMNGRDLARNILSLYPNIKRLFMSGYTANTIAHHGVLDEGVHFIQKPFSVSNFAAKVREVLG